MTKVVLASASELKMTAVERALRSMGMEALRVVGVAVDSFVDGGPMDEAVKQGAVNRLSRLEWGAT